MGVRKSKEATRGCRLLGLQEVSLDQSLGVSPGLRSKRWAGCKELRPETNELLFTTKSHTKTHLEIGMIVL